MHPALRCEPGGGQCGPVESSADRAGARLRTDGQCGRNPQGRSGADRDGPRHQNSTDPRRAIDRQCRDRQPGQLLVNADNALMAGAKLSAGWRRATSVRAGGTIGPRTVPAIEAAAGTARDRVGSANPRRRRAILHDRSRGDQSGRNGSQRGGSLDLGRRLRIGDTAPLPTAERLLRGESLGPPTPRYMNAWHALIPTSWFNGPGAAIADGPGLTMLASATTHSPNATG